MSPELLTVEEKQLIADVGDLAGRIRLILVDGPNAHSDFAEFIFHIHALQTKIMAQAAARAYPRQFRLLGDSKLLSPERYGPTDYPASCPGCGALDFDPCVVDCPGVAEVTG